MLCCRSSNKDEDGVKLTRKRKRKIEIRIIKRRLKKDRGAADGDRGAPLVAAPEGSVGDQGDERGGCHAYACAQERVEGGDRVAATLEGVQGDGAPGHVLSLEELDRQGAAAGEGGAEAKFGEQGALAAAGGLGDGDGAGAEAAGREADPDPLGAGVEQEGVDGVVAVLAGG